MDGGAGTLSWALGYVDALPPYDKQFDVDAFMNNFPSVEPIYERVSRPPSPQAEASA